MIQDVVVINPDGHGDERGKFYETYRRSWFPLGREMVQGNTSVRSKDSLVGLHYHLHQADYWTCPSGLAHVVLHDLRVGSPTDGVTQEIVLSGNNHRGVYIPPGVAHGFLARTNMTLMYLVDNYYNPDDELGVAWNDRAIGATWGCPDLFLPIVSDRDKANPERGMIPVDRRPHMGLRR